MTINDFSLGDKFQYLGREAMRVPFSRFGYGYPINAVDVETGQILFVPEENEVQATKISSMYLLQDDIKSFDQLFVGEKFFWNGDFFVRSSAFLNSEDVFVDAYCLTDGKMASFWGDDKIIPIYEIKKGNSK